MENGQAGDDRLAANSEDSAFCDVKTKKLEEVTQLESKTTTLQVQSESSNLSTSTLSTETLVPSKEENTNCPYVTEEKSASNDQTPYCEEISTEVTDKRTKLLNLESVHAAKESNAEPANIPERNQQSKTIEENIEIVGNAIYPITTLALNTEQPQIEKETEQQSFSDDSKLNIKLNPSETLEQNRKKTLKILSEEALAKFNQKTSEHQTNLSLGQGEQEKTAVYQREAENPEVVQNNFKHIQEQKFRTPQENNIQTIQTAVVETQEIQLPLSKEQSPVIQVSEEQPTRVQHTEDQPIEKELSRELSREQPFEEQQPQEQPTEEQPFKVQPSEEHPFKEQPSEEQPFKEQLSEEQPYKEQPSEENPSKNQPSDKQPPEEHQEKQVQFPQSKVQTSEEQPSLTQTSKEQSSENQPSEEHILEEQAYKEQLSEEQPSEGQPSEEQPLGEKPSEEQPSGQPSEEQPLGEQPSEEQPSESQPSEEQIVKEQSSKAQPLKGLPLEEKSSAEVSSEKKSSGELQSSEVLQITESVDSCSETAVANPPFSDTANNKEAPQSAQLNTMADVDSQKIRKEIRSAEIQEESIKNQLHEIIHEIDIEVSRDEEDGGIRPHTWQPKGRYEIRRTPIKYEDIVPVEIPDIQITERKIVAAKPVPKQKPQRQEISLEPLKILRHTVENGEPISPLEIPVGIPLLAKILPKEENGEEEGREKIPLERLFTPATDADEIAPQKKKRAFASSSFYGPDHPTIDDQLELAHKISVSLIDENNKSSKGQNMYMKRKNRSSKWIHQGEATEQLAAEQYEMDDVEEENQQPLEKPPLKLVLNPKGMQDYSAVQRHYEELLSSSESVQQITRMELGMEIANNLESPTGKGAALFAKRKKRMDKFIVDEMSVQQQQKQQTPPVQDEVKPLHKTDARTSTQKSFSSHQTTTVTKNGPASLLLPSVAQPGNQLPDLTTILTQPKPPEKKTSATSSPYSSGRSTIKTKPVSTSRSRSADSKSSLLAKSASTATFSAFNTPSSNKTRVGELKRTASGSSFNAFSDKSFNALMQNLEEDPLANLRPGSPPVVLVPDGKGGFVEKREILESSKPVNASTNDATPNNEGGAIYTAEVKVVQKKSLPSTPNVEIPVAAPANYTIFDQLSTATDEEKRKSFNFAAKGWGTYNNFYTPLHLEVL